ncbi:MAG: CYTH domain-containing protein [Victivallaceae bacterium]|nr:CYTH domain-containing protein [Victivallaceae bacterium]
MAMEIERKFLVSGDSWRSGCAEKLELRQGYIAGGDGCIVRVRVSDTDGWITVKGPARNISRSEFEYRIPREDAEIMLLDFAAGRIVEKTRYFIDHKGGGWIIDEFSGRNCGLVLAEIELDSEDAFFAQPDWLGKEVSGDYRYHNSYLSRNPYSEWKEK